MDPTIMDYCAACQQQGQDPDWSTWWHTCPIDDLCIQRVMAEMPTDKDSCTWEQHHVERARKHKEKPAKKGCTALFTFDHSAPPDMRKLLA